MTPQTKTHRSHTIVACFAVSAVALAACGSSASNSQTPASSSVATPAGGVATSPPTTADYHPVIDPAKFVAVVDNQYFPLKPGTTNILEGTRDGAPNRHEMVITNETKVIMGVTCLVIRDTVTAGGALVEATTDWYAQDADGNVWYFGEDTKEYTNGQVSSTAGSWEGGVDNAVPGIIMEAHPKIGDNYRQEYRPGIAEDMAKVVSVDPTVTVPLGSYQNVLVTEDTNPLDPDRIDTKKYAPGVGLVYTKRIRTGHMEEASLVKVTTA